MKEIFRENYNIIKNTDCEEQHPKYIQQFKEKLNYIELIQNNQKPVSNQIAFKKINFHNVEIDEYLKNIKTGEQALNFFANYGSTLISGDTTPVKFFFAVLKT